METHDCTPLPETFWESVVARMDVQLSQCDEAHTLFAVYCQLHNDLVDELKQAQLDLRNLIGSAPLVYTEVRA